MTLLKYLIVGCVIVLGGPLILKKLFGSDTPPDLYIDARNVLPKVQKSGKVKRRKNEFVYLLFYSHKHLLFLKKKLFKSS